MRKICFALIITLLYVASMGLAGEALILESHSISVIDNELIAAYDKLPDKSDKQSVMIMIEDLNVDVDSFDEDMYEVNSSLSSDNEPRLHNIKRIKEIMLETNGEYDTELLEKLVYEQRAAYQNLYSQKNADFVEEYLKNYDVSYVCSHFPIIIVNASLSEVLSLSKKREINCITITDNVDNYLEDQDESVNRFEENALSANAGVLSRIQEVEAYNSQYLDIANISYLKNTVKLSGNGIKIGLVDKQYPYEEYQSALNVVPVSNDGDLSAQFTHPTDMASVLHSIANDSTIYCAATNRAGGVIPAIDLLLQKDVDVISISVDPGPDLKKYSDQIDALIWREYRNVFISTGNTTDNGYNGYAGYNSIGVGAVDVHGKILDISCYSAFNSSSDAHNPDICAPGENFKLLSTLGYASGTSFSTPMVAGLVALLCQVDSYLKYDPCTVKALLTSSVNPSSRNLPIISDSKFEMYGSGIIDGKIAYNTLKATHYKEEALFGNPKLYEEHDYPVYLKKGDVIRVSMCYDRAQNTTDTLDKLANIVLYLYSPDSKSVAVSSASQSNVKICEYTATKEGNYTIKVVHFAAGSAIYGIDYGLAWTIT